MSDAAEPLFHNVRAINNSPGSVYTRNLTTSRSAREGEKQANFTRRFHSYKVACFVSCTRPKDGKKEAYIDRLFTSMFHAAVISA